MCASFCWSLSSVTVTRFRPLIQTYYVCLYMINTTLLPWQNLGNTLHQPTSSRGPTGQEMHSRHHYVRVALVNITSRAVLVNITSRAVLVSTLRGVKARYNHGAPRRRAVHHSVLSCKRVASRCTLLYISSIKYTSVNSSKYKSLCYLKCTASW